MTSRALNILADYGKLEKKLMSIEQEQNFGEITSAIGLSWREKIRKRQPFTLNNLSHSKPDKVSVFENIRVKSNSLPARRADVLTNCGHQQNKKQWNPINKTKTKPKDQTKPPAKLKTDRFVANTSASNLNKVISKQNNELYKKSVAAIESNNTETYIDRLKLKNIYSSVVEKSYQDHSKHSIASMLSAKFQRTREADEDLMESLPSLTNHMTRPNKLTWKADVNENARDNRPSEKRCYQIYTPTRYDSLFVPKNVNPILESGGGTKADNSQNEKDEISSMIAKNKDFYHVYFHLLVESFQTTDIIRSRQLPMTLLSRGCNDKECSSEEQNNSTNELTARSFYHNSRTYNSNVSDFQAEFKAPKFNNVKEAQDLYAEYNHKTMYVEPFAIRKVKASKDPSKMKIKCQIARTKKKGTLKYFNGMSTEEELMRRNQSMYNMCSVWKHFLKSRDSKTSDAKGGLEPEDDTGMIEGSTIDKNIQLHVGSRKSEEILGNLVQGVFSEQVSEEVTSGSQLTTPDNETKDNQNKPKFEKVKRSPRFPRSFLLEYPLEVKEVLFPPYTLCSEDQTGFQSEESEEPRNQTSEFDISMLFHEKSFNISDSYKDREDNKKKKALLQPHYRTAITGPQGPMLSETVLDDFNCETFPETVEQVCKVKGYEIIRRLTRGTSCKYINVFLANSNKNPSYTPVEVITYVQPYTHFLTINYCGDAKQTPRHSKLSRIMPLPVHKNLVTLLHRFCSPQLVYQVTEHFPWPSLSHLINTSSNSWVGNVRKGLNEDTRRIIFKQICNGMEHLHLFGVLHGGLNCHNILVSERTVVKLADYGPACQRMTFNFDMMKGRIQLKVMSCDSYTPPEMMITPTSWNRSCDVWCMGIVLLEMSLGKIPTFVNGAIRLSGSTKMLERIGLENCGYQLSLLIDKILQSRPSQRPRVSSLARHAWLSDGTELAEKVKRSMNKAKRTDGSTFPLPKRVQKHMLPKPEDFYDTSECESLLSEGHKHDSETRESYGCPEEPDRSDATSPYTSPENESSKKLSEDICTDIQNNPSSLKQSLYETIFLKKDDKVDVNIKTLCETKGDKGFLFSLLDDLNGVINKDSSNEKNACSKPYQKRRRNVERRKLFLLQRYETQRTKRFKQVSCASVQIDRLVDSEIASPHRKVPVTHQSASCSRIFKKYRQSEQSSSQPCLDDDTSSGSIINDSNEEFVMEDDEKAFEEIDNIIDQEEKIFWANESVEVNPVAIATRVVT